MVLSLKLHLNSLKIIFEVIIKKVECKIYGEPLKTLDNVMRNCYNIKHETERIF